MKNKKIKTAQRFVLYGIEATPIGITSEASNPAPSALSLKTQLAGFFLFFFVVEYGHALYQILIGNSVAINLFLQEPQGAGSSGA